MSSKLERLDPKVLACNPRCRLDAWRKYEPVVLAAYAKHPMTYSYTPGNMAVSTVVSRIRDAIRGCIAFKHPTSVSHDLLAAWWDEIVIKHDDTTVHIGPEVAVVSTLEGHTPTKDSDFTFDSLSLEEVAAFTILLSTNRLRGPIIVRQPPNISLLLQNERPNVELMLQSDGQLVIL